jgi:hypothetical protein
MSRSFDPFPFCCETPSRFIFRLPCSSADRTLPVLAAILIPTHVWPLDLYSNHPLMSLFFSYQRPC